jgi:putative spermidine/putrescine transport system permease protein
MEGRLVRAVLRLWTAGVLAFLFVPIVIICVYAFNPSVIQTWPITGVTVRWFTVAWHDPQVRAALWLSVRAGLAATAVALVLGSAAAFGVHRFRFFGREAVSLLLVLPISLPGIITGIALNSAFGFAGIGLSAYTIIIGHATFCIVVVYNNVLARLRRMPGSVYEAAADLGAHGWFTFRTVTMPMLSTALVSGALLAFALSFDEVIVTTFTAGAQNTLPLWIFGAIRLGQQLPEVNVVVTVVLLLTLIPVAIAARLTGSGGITRTSVRAAVGAETAVAGAGPAAGSAGQTPAAPTREPIP